MGIISGIDIGMYNIKIISILEKKGPIFYKIDKIINIKKKYTVLEQNILLNEISSSYNLNKNKCIIGFNSNKVKYIEIENKKNKNMIKYIDKHLVSLEDMIYSYFLFDNDQKIYFFYTKKIQLKKINIDLKKMNLNIDIIGMNAYTLSMLYCYLKMKNKIEYSHIYINIGEKCTDYCLIVNGLVHSIGYIEVGVNVYLKKLNRIKLKDMELIQIIKKQKNIFEYMEKDQEILNMQKCANEIFIKIPKKINNLIFNYNKNRIYLLGEGLNIPGMRDFIKKNINKSVQYCEDYEYFGINLLDKPEYAMALSNALYGLSKSKGIINLNKKIDNGFIDVYKLNKWFNKALKIKLIFFFICFSFLFTIGSKFNQNKMKIKQFKKILTSNHKKFKNDKEWVNLNSTNKILDILFKEQLNNNIPISLYANNKQISISVKSINELSSMDLRNLKVLHKKILKIENIKECVIKIEDRVYSFLITYKLNNLKLRIY